MILWEYWHLLAPMTQGTGLDTLPMSLCLPYCFARWGPILWVPHPPTWLIQIEERSSLPGDPTTQYAHKPPLVTL
jgi:hypothetical protein